MMFQTKFAEGRKTTPVPYNHGQECVAIFEHVFTADYTAATDIIELGVLPATARITGATLIGEGLGATTADVGIMEGPAGEATDAEGNQRELTADLLFDGVSVNDNEAAAAALTCLGIDVDDDEHRAIGATVAADVAAGAAKKLTVVLRYIYD